MTTYTTQGMTVGRGDAGSPETYTTIPQITNIGSVGQSRSLIDVTNLSSTAREYKKAIKDGAEIQLEMQYDPNDASHTGLKADNDSESARNFRITFTDSPATKFDFAALVTNWAVTNLGIDQVAMLNVTLKPTGDITIS